MWPETLCAVLLKAFATAFSALPQAGLTPYPGVCEGFRLHAAAVYRPAGDLYPKAFRPDNPKQKAGAIRQQEAYASDCLTAPACLV